MVSTTKPLSASGGRRKSSKGSRVVILKLSTTNLQTLAAPSVTPVKEESPLKDSLSTTSNTLPATASSAGDNPSESNSNTPAPNGTPVPSSMPPPTEGVKKKGVKRSSGIALGPDAVLKVRGKPGPKKKARLEDGTIDHSSSTPKGTVAGAGAATGHKLGPKANQGAINAGLRALDRSGKPCRKWQKGGFKVKSFTGVVWEIPRWRAPPKTTIQGESEGSASGDSSKENKDSSQIESGKSNSAGDAEMTSIASQNVSSPAPVIAASA